jgi:hypothetical protein
MSQPLNEENVAYNTPLLVEVLQLAVCDGFALRTNYGLLFHYQYISAIYCL